jgi:hypothetical protein
MIVNLEKHPYLFTYDPNNPRLEWVFDGIWGNSYLRARADNLDDYDFWFCQFSCHNSFDVYPIETLMDAETLNKIKNKEIFLVCDNTNECFNSSVDGIYKNLVIKSGIPESQIILASGSPDVVSHVNFIAKKLGKDPIKVEWFSSQEFTVKCADEAIKKRVIHLTLFPGKEYKKKFLNLNRRWRLHRPALVALIHERKLLPHGYVSLGQADDNKSWDETWAGSYSTYGTFPEIRGRLFKGASLKNLLPLYVDTTDLVTNRAQTFAEDLIDNFYIDTYFSVVSETNYDSGPGKDGRFLTEKTFKCIVLGHPFILVSPPHSLDLLKKIGYKTFSPFIDESYDKEENDSKRLLAIVNEIERLCNLSSQELAVFLDECKKICWHNYEVFNNQKNFVYRII